MPRGSGRKGTPWQFTVERLAPSNSFVSDKVIISLIYRLLFGGARHGHNNLQQLVQGYIYFYTSLTTTMPEKEQGHSNSICSS